MRRSRDIGVFLEWVFNWLKIPNPRYTAVRLMTPIIGSKRFIQVITSSQVSLLSVILHFTPQ